MQLFQSWRESLNVFIPKNFSLFGMASLNAVFETFKVWVRLFWPLFIVSFLMDIFPIFKFRIGPFQSSVGGIIGLFSAILLFITLYLSLRPSTKIKNYSYFNDYRVHAGVIATLLLVKGFFFNLLFAFGSLGVDVFSFVMFSSFSVVVSTIFMLFYFDSDGGIKALFASVLRTFKMLWLWFPFFFIVVWGSGVLSSVVASVAKLGFFPFVFFSGCFSFGIGFKFLWALAKLFSILFAVIPASLCATFYTKKIHEQSKLFFN